MAIFRGDGGSGDSTTDAYASQVAQDANTASTKASEAAASATAAANSATAAAASESSVSADATAAAASASSASTSASSASTSATNAASSATSASTSATNAASSESNASTSEANAASSAATAATQASNASTSATNAANSATAAATSATNAAASESSVSANATAAAASETNAATSETNAASSETAAATSASNAATSESNASTSATNAANSATAASTSATNAATSETNASNSASAASTSATNAATSASAAATSESNAASSASSASTSATNASTSATNAASSAASAAASYDSFDDRYLGTKASDPSTDNDGDSLVTGALYYNTSDGEMRVYTGSSWLAAYIPSTEYLQLSGGTMTGSLTVDSVDINGGTIDGTVIGGSTPAAATFSSLVANSLTYPTTDGTSGQAIITDGSGALSFGDVSGGGGITYVTKTANYTTSAGEGVIADTSGGAFTITLPPSPSTGDQVIIADGSNWATTNLTVGRNGSTIEGVAADLTCDVEGISVTMVYDGSTWQLYPQTGTSPSLGIDDNATSTAITIDSSQNVGIGTSSPASFNSSGNDLVVGNGVASNDTGITVYTNSNATGHLLFADGTSGASAYAGYIRYAHANDFMAFHTNAGAERMRIDSSGNVGIGTTSPATKLHVKGTWTNGEGILQIDADSGTQYSGLTFQNNGTVNTYFYHDNTNNLTFLGSITGQPLVFASNTNGVSGEAMRIDSSGRVGIGTSSPSGVLAVTDGANGFIVGQSGENFYSGNTHRFFSQNYTTEHLHINASGNVGIGTTSPAEKLTVAAGSTDRAGFRISGATATLVLGNQNTGAGTSEIKYDRSYNILTFSNGTTGSLSERMRIDSSGNLLVGKTAYSVVGQGHLLSPSGETFHTITTGLNTLHVYNGTDSSYKFYVLGNGGIANFSSNNVNLSDQRAKKDIVDSDNYLEKLCNIPVKNFRYNEDAEDGKHHLGVISQDVEAVVPEFVNKSSWEHKDGLMDTVYNTDLMFAMMKSIQELSAQVNELKAKVAALEAN